MKRRHENEIYEISGRTHLRRRLEQSQMPYAVPLRSPGVNTFFAPMFFHQVQQCFFYPTPESFYHLNHQLPGILDFNLAEILLRNIVIYLKRQKPDPNVRNLLSALTDKVMCTYNERGNGVSLSTWIMSKQSHSIAFLIYNLGFLAREHILEGKLATCTVGIWLNQLASLHEIKSRNISNALYGLGALAQTRNLDGQLSMSAVTHLMQRLAHAHDLDSQAVSNSLYGLGLLAQAGHLNGQLPRHQDIFLLLQRLTTLHDIQNQNISNSLYGLGLLLKTHCLASYDDQATLSNLIERLLESAESPVHANQVLSCLAAIRNPKPFRVDITKNHIQSLFRIATPQNYIHPNQAALLMNALVIFREHQSLLQPYFELINSALTVPLNRFPESIRQQLVSNVDMLVDVPQWERSLSHQLGFKAKSDISVQSSTQSNSSTFLQASLSETSHTQPSSIRPRMQAAGKATSSKEDSTWRAACQNAIFSAVANHDLYQLMQILGLDRHLSWMSVDSDDNSSLTNRTMPASKTTTRDLRQQKSRSNTAAMNNQLVTQFFEKTPAQVLKTLISQSKHEYFSNILRACSRHTRYQLAQSKALHPIWLYLPMKEVNLLVKHVNNRLLAMYIDSRSVLSIVDALMIRSTLHPEEQKTILELQMSLLKKAFEHHKLCRNTHVLAKLAEIKNQLERNTLTVVGEDTETEPQATLRTQISNDTTFMEQPIIDRWHQHRGVNTNYLYTNDDIQAILTSRVKNYPQVYVLAAAQINHGVPGNQVSDVVRQFIQANPRESGMRQLLLPVQNQNHWVGLLIRMNGNCIEQIHYYDSLADDSNRNLQIIKQDLIQARMMDVHSDCIFKRQALQQTDGTSCGVLTIENLYCALKGKWWQENKVLPVPDGLIRQIRARHLSILQTARPDYAPRFQQAQFADHSAFPSVGQQLCSHGFWHANRSDDAETEDDRLHYSRLT